APHNLQIVCFVSPRQGTGEPIRFRLAHSCNWLGVCYPTWYCAVLQLLGFAPQSVLILTVVASQNLIFARGDNMGDLMQRFFMEEEGQDLVEYALLLVFLALAAIAVLPTLGKAVNNVFSQSASSLTSAS